MIFFLKLNFSLIVIVLSLTGCSSSPTHFASPDAENYRYKVVEGDSVKVGKPKPRTIGFHEWEWEGKTSGKPGTVQSALVTLAFADGLCGYCRGSAPGQVEWYLGFEHLRV